MPDPEFYARCRRQVQELYGEMMRQNLFAREISELTELGQQTLYVIEGCERHNTIAFVEAHFEPFVIDFSRHDEAQAIPNPTTTTHDLEICMQRFRNLCIRIATRLLARPAEPDRSRPPAIFDQMGHFSDGERTRLQLLTALEEQVRRLAAQGEGQQMRESLQQEVERLQGLRQPFPPEPSPFEQQRISAFSSPQRLTDEQRQAIMEQLNFIPPGGLQPIFARFQEYSDQIHNTRQHFDTLGRKPTWRELRNMVEQDHFPPGVIAAICHYFDLPMDSTVTGQFEQATPLREEYDEEELGLETDEMLGMGSAETWFRERMEEQHE